MAQVHVEGRQPTDRTASPEVGAGRPGHAPEAQGWRLGRGDALRLQRRAGNRVVARALDAGVVQRKRAVVDVPQGVRTSDADATTENTDTIAHGPAHVWSYAFDLPPAGAARDAAIGAARAAYRSVGQSFTSDSFLARDPVVKLIAADRAFAKRVFDVLAPPGQAVVGDEQARIDVPDPRPTTPAAIQELMKAVVWNAQRLDRLRGAASIDKLDDPAKVTLRVPYGAVDAAELGVDAMFTEGQKGYVVAVRDTRSNTNASMKKRTNYAGEQPGNVAQIDNAYVERGKQIKTVKHYSNVHHTSTSKTASEMIGALDDPGHTKADVEGAVDAITKVIAEGGRFRCVEALGTDLRNDSLFYAKVDGRDAYRQIELRKLWKVWAAGPFNAKYGITDVVVRDWLLRSNRPAAVQEVEDEPAATGYHYDVAQSTRR